MFKNDEAERITIADLQSSAKELTEAEAKKIEGGVIMTPDGRTCTEPRFPKPIPLPKPIGFPPKPLTPFGF